MMMQPIKKEGGGGWHTFFIYKSKKVVSSKETVNISLWVEHSFCIKFADLLTRISEFLITTALIVVVFKIGNYLHN